ncbi:hypothetical protein D3C80_1582950 [compost metagenome]
MPVQFSDVAKEVFPSSIAKVRQGFTHQVQANANHAQSRHVVQRLATDAWLQHHDSSQLLRHLPQRRQQVTIVGTEKARLHQHAMT